VEVAIALNIRESEVTQYCREYWTLIQLDALNHIYQEIKYDIWHVVNLYRSVKSTDMNVQHVIRLLEIVNNQKQRNGSARIFQEINDKILSMRNWLDSINLDCEKELAQRDQLYQERMKLQASVRQFQNNNEEYAKLKKLLKKK
jgi:hypothetical protein